MNERTYSSMKPKWILKKRRNDNIVCKNALSEPVLNQDSSELQDEGLQPSDIHSIYVDSGLNGPHYKALITITESHVHSSRFTPWTTVRSVSPFDTDI